MAHVLSAQQFFDHDKYSEVREALLELQKIPIQIADQVSLFVNQISEEQHIAHQLYVLEKFESIDQISINENALLLNGYDPTFLVESGIYEKTVELVQATNENILSWLKGAWSAMTEDNSPIGIFQFILDLIGLIPKTWGALIGLPGIDIAANLLNAIIYAIREKWLLCIINLIACFDLSGIFRPLKLGIKAIAAPASKMISKFFTKGAAKEAATTFTKEAASNPTMVKTFGKMLASLSNWLAKTGLSLLKNIVPAIVKAVDKLTLGAFKLDTLIPKMTKTIDEWIAKLSIFTKEADEASKIILSPTTAKAAEDTLKQGAENVGKAAVDTAQQVAKKPLNVGAQNAVHAAASQKVLKDLGEIKWIDKNMLDASTAKFQKLFPGVTDPVIMKNFMYNDATNTLVANVLSRKTGLLSITGNKKLMQKLYTGGAWKGPDKLLAKAIKKGNPEELGKIMQKLIDEPEFFKLISKTSPDVAKTMALFKNVPEVLVNGSKAFSEFGANLAYKMAHVNKTAQALSIFLTKILLKGTDCGRAIAGAQTTNDAADMLSQKVATSISPEVVQQVTEILSKVAINEQDDESFIEDASAALADLQQNNPEGYEIYNKTEQEVDASAEQLKKATESDNPCTDTVTNKQAEVGAIYNANNAAWKKGTVVTDLDNTEKWKESNLNEYNKNTLKLLKQDTNIDAQHPLADQSPIIKAYFSDVVSVEGQISPNVDKESRLDKSLDYMVKSGQIDETEKVRLRASILKMWKDATIPSEILNVEVGQPNPNESIFRIGKILVTK